MSDTIIMPDSEFILKGQDIIDIITEMENAHDELVMQNKKLSDIYIQNERKILCYKSGIELVNQLVSKANSNEINNISVTTTTTD